jgi:hypothetical protein
MPREKPLRDMGHMQREAGDRGIPCRQCRSTDRRVLRTRRGDGVIVRETICLHCHDRQTTFETA